MRRTIIALALALPACENSEAKLDRCKAEMKTDHQQTLAVVRQEADKQAKALADQGPPEDEAREAREFVKKLHDDMRSQRETAAAKLEQLNDVLMQTWQGAAGVAECERTLAASRKLRAQRVPLRRLDRAHARFKRHR